MGRRFCLVIAALAVAALLPTGSAAPAAAQMPPPGAQPPAGPETVERIYGQGRVQTAVAVARSWWQTADHVLLAAGGDFPDALVAAALAARLGAPILLTEGHRLHPDVLGEIRRLQARTVTVLGGTAAVAESVAEALRADGRVVRRLAGPTRYGTAAAVAAEAGAPSGEAVVASGAAFPDALAAGALAATEQRLPTLLTRPDGLPPETERALADLGVRRVLVLGGSAAVAPAVESRLRALGYQVERLGGPTRYDTAAMVAGEALRRRIEPTMRLFAASGDGFADVLTAAPLAARAGGLLVLVPGERLLRAVRVTRLLAQSGERFPQGFVVGGPAAVADDVVDGLRVAVNATTPPRTPTATGNGGAAASVSPLATGAALATLALGGNAVDATVAAAGVLGVVQPYSAGIGGGGFMVIYSAADDASSPTSRVSTIDSREQAPAGYHPRVFLDENGDPIPFSERVISGLGVGVPGTVAGWDLALRRHGTLPLSELLQPGIELARYGFPVDATFSAQTEANREKLATFAPTRALYLPGDRAPAEGDWFRNPDLAGTYERIAAEGARAFYTGEIAEALVAAVRQPPVASDNRRTVRPSPMTVEDLARYEALVRAPVLSTYRDVTVAGMGLPSSGGLTIALALNQLERFPMGTFSRERALHHYLESTRLAWADRNAYMGDPAFVDVPERGLLSDEYALERSLLIEEAAAAEQRQPGDPWRYEGRPRPASTAAQVETRTVGSTTHLTVSDESGNVVSYTFTIESIGGSGIVVPGYGFLLNNELTDFDPVPPHPNQPEAGKRPRSSMSPTIVLRDGQPLFAVGSPGGATIITTVLQIIVDVVDLGADLPSAVAAPRVANFNPANLRSTAEEAFLATPEAEALRSRGHEFNAVSEIGAATGIAFGPDGAVTAVAEPRRRGVGSAGVLAP